MEESKYGKYIVTELFQNFNLPGYRAWEKDMIGQGEVNGQRRVMEHMVWMDSNVIPGAYYAEMVWFWPQARPKIIKPEDVKHSGGVPQHVHPFPEVLSYFGTDMDHPQELYGEIEFWLEDEKFILDKSFIVYIPAGMKHCPLKTLRMDAPMFHFTMGPGQNYR
jgi:hypothetical protein